MIKIIGICFVLIIGVFENVYAHAVAYAGSTMFESFNTPDMSEIM
jgi:hypothetical protein